ncbi:hypothetical protein V1639_09025 [Pseudarthrobacter sp. J75]|uniref:hypothetical protein n=1 Tax=unclassified Pseudarthrobacter TaxID=2647000 RepID=UPI002E810B05|nr:MULTISPECIES: hypothetical protein [unclassified Pseudarthrobacter]MEE2522499.1 hypothetical protein [Pseudarthrobacter sp. J47]MEE2529170.1 hypothetical protein [Pseudarthrobacter sp. J75]MEE2570457.1 hypothetical protein [Pseudarthrobacter sp. J64]
MDHKLRPIVRVDAYLRSATVELHGCLTVPATTALLRILGRGRSLNPRMDLGLDLRHARHIDEDCLKVLHVQDGPHPSFPDGAAYQATRWSGARTSGDIQELDADVDDLGHVTVLMPPVWPVCPVEKALAGTRRKGLHA